MSKSRSFDWSKIFFWLQALLLSAIYWRVDSAALLPVKQIGTVLMCVTLFISSFVFTKKGANIVPGICTVGAAISLVLFSVGWEWALLPAFPLLAVPIAAYYAHARRTTKGRAIIGWVAFSLGIGSVLAKFLAMFPAWIPALILLFTLPSPVIAPQPNTPIPRPKIHYLDVVIIILTLIITQFMTYFGRALLQNEAFASIQPWSVNVAAVLGFGLFAALFVWQPLRRSFLVFVATVMVGLLIFFIPGSIEAAPGFLLLYMIAGGGLDMLTLAVPFMFWEDNTSYPLAVMGLLIARIINVITVSTEGMFPENWVSEQIGRIGLVICINLAALMLALTSRWYTRVVTVTETVYVEVPTINENPPDIISTTPVESPQKQLPSSLTPREREIANLLLQGKARNEIAELLGISPNTVSNQRTSIFRKTNCKNHVEFISVYTSRNP